MVGRRCLQRAVPESETRSPQSQRDCLTEAQGWCAEHLPWVRIPPISPTLKGLNHRLARRILRPCHMSFQDEFRRLLQRYEVAYDEAYVWD